MDKVKISQKGQISLPASLRRKLDLKTGDQLYVEEQEGTIVLRPFPKHPLLALKGKYRNQNDLKLKDTLLEERNADRQREK